MVRQWHPDRLEKKMFYSYIFSYVSPLLHAYGMCLSNIIVFRIIKGILHTQKKSIYHFLNIGKNGKRRIQKQLKSTNFRMVFFASDCPLPSSLFRRYNQYTSLI